MDNFRAIYRILSMLEKSLDVEEFDWNAEINAEKLKISETRFNSYVIMLIDEGYISGLEVKH